MDNNVDENIKQLINNKFHDNVDMNDIQVFNGIYHENVLFRASDKRIRKTDDRFFENISGNIVKIFKIVLYNNKCYILGYVYIVQSLCIENIIIDPILEVLSKSLDLEWFSLDIIKKKVVHINIENISYFCRMPNTFEIQ